MFIWLVKIRLRLNEEYPKLDFMKTIVGLVLLTSLWPLWLIEEAVAQLYEKSPPDLRELFRSDSPGSRF